MHFNYRFLYNILVDEEKLRTRSKESKTSTSPKRSATPEDDAKSRSKSKSPSLSIKSEARTLSDVGSIPPPPKGKRRQKQEGPLGKNAIIIHIDDSSIVFLVGLRYFNIFLMQ